jgi:hypothetical protein
MCFCFSGFGVGHMRDTKTKGKATCVIDVMDMPNCFCSFHLKSLCFLFTGIWVWGTPVELDIDGVRTSVFYLDTEGFESVGKSNVYDDR